MDPGDGAPEEGLEKELEKTAPQYMTFTVKTYNCTICPGSETAMGGRGFLTKDGYLQHMRKEHRDWKKHYQLRFGPPGPPAHDGSDSAISSSSSSSDLEEEESPIEDESDDDDVDDDENDENEGMEIEEGSEEPVDDVNISDNQVTSTTNCHDTIIQEEEEEDINEGLKSKITNEPIDLEGLVLTERNEIGLTSPTTSTAETLVSTDDENESSTNGSEIKTPEKKETESKEVPQSQSNDDNKEKNDEKIEIKKENEATIYDDINCSICSKNFANEEDLQEHYEEEHDEEQVCGQCTKVFPTGLSLYKHEKVHFKFPCSICEWRFRNKEKHDQHWPIHFGSSNVFDSNRRRREEKLIKFFNCPDDGCKRVFDSDRSLKLHVAKKHPELKSPTNTPPKKKRTRTSSNNSQSSSTTSTSKSSTSIMRATSPTNSNASMSLSSISTKSSRSTPRNRKNKNIKAKGLIGSKNSTPTAIPETEINIPLPKKPKLLSLTSHFDSSDEESSSEKEVRKSKSKHQTQKVVSAVLSTLQRQKSQSANSETVQKESQEQEQESHSKSKSNPTSTSEILKTSTADKAISSNSNSKDKFTITTKTPVTTTTTMGMSSALINLYTELDRQKLTNKKTSSPKPPVKVPAALLNLKFGSAARPKTVPPVTSSSFSWPQKTPTPTPTTQGQDQGQEPDTLATGTGKTQDNLKNQTDTTSKNQNENDTTTTTTTTNKNQKDKDTTKKKSKAPAAALLNLKFGLSSRPLDKTTVPPLVTSSSLEQKTPAPVPSPAKEPSNPSTLTLTLASNLQDNSKNLNEKDTTAKKKSKAPAAALLNLKFGLSSRPLAEDQPPVTTSSSSSLEQKTPASSPAKGPSNPSTSTLTLASNLQDKDKDNSKNLNEKDTTTKEPSNPSITSTLTSKLQDKNNSKNLNEKDTTNIKKISKAVPAVLSNLGFGPLSRPLDKTVPPMTMPVTSTNTISSSTFSLTQKTSTPTIIPTESSNTLTTKIQDNSNSNINEKDTETATATANLSFTCKTGAGAGTEKNDSPGILLQQSQHQLIVDCDDNDGPRSIDATHSFQNDHEIGSKSINARLIEFALSSVNGTEQNNSSIDPNISLFQAFQSQSQRIVDDNNDGPRSANSLQNAHESGSKNINSRLIELAQSNVNEKKSVQSPVVGNQKRQTLTRWNTDTDHEQNCNMFQVQGQHQYQFQSPPRNQFCPRPRPMPLFSQRLYRPYYTYSVDNWRGYFSPGQVRGFRSPRFDYRVQMKPVSNSSQQRQSHRHQSPVRGFKSPTTTNSRFQSNPSGLNLSQQQQHHQGPAQGIESPGGVIQFQTKPVQIKSPTVTHQIPANSAQEIKSPTVIHQLKANSAQRIAESPAIHQLPAQGIESPAVIHQIPTNSAQEIKSLAVLHRLIRAPTGFQSNPVSNSSQQLQRHQSPVQGSKNPTAHNRFQSNLALNLPQQRHQGPAQVVTESPAVIYQLPANLAHIIESPAVTYQLPANPAQEIKSPGGVIQFQTNPVQIKSPTVTHQLKDNASQIIKCPAAIHQLPANSAQRIESPSVIHQLPAQRIESPVIIQLSANSAQGIALSPGVNHRFTTPTSTGFLSNPASNSNSPQQLQRHQSPVQGFKSPTTTNSRFQSNLALSLPQQQQQRHQGPAQVVTESPAVIYQLPANLAQIIESPAVTYQLPANLAQGIKSPAAMYQLPANPAQEIKSSAVTHRFPTQRIESPVIIHHLSPAGVNHRFTRAPTSTGFLSNPASNSNSPQQLQRHQSPVQGFKSPTTTNSRFQLNSALNLPQQQQQRHQGPCPSQEIKSPEVIQFPTNPDPISNSPQSPNHSNGNVDLETTGGNSDSFFIDYNHGQQIRFSSDFQDFSK